MHPCSHLIHPRAAPPPLQELSEDERSCQSLTRNLPAEAVRRYQKQKPPDASPHIMVPTSPGARPRSRAAVSVYLLHDWAQESQFIAQSLLFHTAPAECKLQLSENPPRGSSCRYCCLDSLLSSVSKSVKNKTLYFFNCR